MKAKEYAATGLIIGLLVGALVGAGIMSQFKASQRSTLMPISIAVGALLFAGIGYTNGKKLGRDVDIEIELGIDKAEESIVQSGRVWIAFTQWTDVNNNTYKLVTGQNAGKVLISQMGEELIMNHHITSGSKINVTKAHQAATLYVFNRQKEQRRLSTSM